MVSGKVGIELKEKIIAMEALNFVGDISACPVRLLFAVPAHASQRLLPVSEPRRTDAIAQEHENQVAGGHAKHG